MTPKSILAFTCPPFKEIERSKPPSHWTYISRVHRYVQMLCASSFLVLTCSVYLSVFVSLTHSLSRTLFTLLLAFLLDKSFAFCCPMFDVAVGRSAYLPLSKVYVCVWLLLFFFFVPILTLKLIYVDSMNVSDIWYRLQFAIHVYPNTMWMLARCLHFHFDMLHLLLLLSCSAILWQHSLKLTIVQLVSLKMNALWSIIISCIVAGCKCWYASVNL